MTYEKFNEFCSALPAATYVVQWGGSHVWKVGVFVDEAPERIEKITARLRLDIAQLHGAETPDCHPRSIRSTGAIRPATWHSSG